MKINISVTLHKTALYADKRRLYTEYIVVTVVVVVVIIMIINRSHCTVVD